MRDMRDDFLNRFSNNINDSAMPQSTMLYWRWTIWRK